MTPNGKRVLLRECDFCHAYASLENYTPGKPDTVVAENFYCSISSNRQGKNKKCSRLEKGLCPAFNAFKLAVEQDN